MNSKTLSHNACYGFTSLAVPLCFNSVKHYLGFTSTAHSDLTIAKYSFYGHKGLYWYALVADECHVMNSLFFVGLSKCVRDFRDLCESLEWEIDDSLALSQFVSQYNKSNNERIS